MDLNLWTEDFFLPQEMGLDVLADQNDGQYGDIKEQGRLGGDWKRDHYEDGVEQLSALSSPGSSSLDEMGWMESDIGSLLDVLASNQQDLSLSPELFDVPSSFPTDSTPQGDLAVFNDFSDTTSSFPTDSTPQGDLAVFNDFSDTNMYLSVGQDSMLTPPESPGHVNPIIVFKEEEIKSEDLCPLSLPKDTDFLLTENGVIFHDGLDLNSICLPLPVEESHQNGELLVQEPAHFLGSPLSADEVESMLSISEPASPQSPKTSSFILSSPELYKVIAAPSDLKNRYSPYTKRKPDQKSKSSKTKESNLDLDLIDIEATLEDNPNLNKKDRKRLQNKNAAIRYRQKKKVESKSIDSEVGGLEEKNQELKSKVEDLEREVKYMKNLMQDIQRAKGVIQ